MSGFVGVTNSGGVWQTTAVVVRVVDGDTMEVEADLGWRISHGFILRVNGIDAPEVSTQPGQTARDFARLVLDPGDVVIITSRQLDKYGRSVADVLLADGRDFAGVMVEAGHAIRKTF